VSYDPTQGTVHTSEAVTHGVRVHVTARYAPSRSDRHRNLWFFLYTIEITNERSDTVQLISRHWIITDADNNLEEVRGPGVVGQQPTLEPGESFEYTSSCPLKTPFGTMHGTYKMVGPEGEELEVAVAPFTLSEPYTIH
jgi:ApaG protein